MKRDEFIKMCALLGISLPFQSALIACSKEDEIPFNSSSEKVLIIGAGAAGMAAGYLLAQRGVNFEILEASSTHGGRMRHNSTFTDFPVPLGAEWLHIEKEIFQEIVNDNSIPVNVETAPYDPATDYGILAGTGQEIPINAIGFTIDQKFVNSSWFGFFEEYVYPSVQSKIRYNTPISAINYSGDQVTVTDNSGQEYSADRAIVAVPVKILQNGAINFTPALPSNKQQAISNAQIWSGCKAFIEFTEKFYLAFIAYITTPETAGQKLYFDAAHGQNSDRNILGLFAVGTEAETYNQITDDNDLRDFMLAELDAVFGNNIASSNYVKHIFQNWNAEPYANGAYIVDHEDWQLVRTLGESVGDRLFFAGDGYTSGEDWSSVHAAARSARRAVDSILG